MSKNEQLAHKLSALCIEKLKNKNPKEKVRALDFLAVDEDVQKLLKQLFQENLESKSINEGTLSNLKRGNTEDLIDLFLLENNIEQKVLSSNVSNSQTMYLEEISKIPLYTKEEEVEMFKKLEQGEDVKNEIAEHNLRLVVSYAKKFSSTRGADFLEMVQEGNIGLLKAIDRFEYKRGYKFSTYATWWIKQSMDRSLKEHQGPLVSFPVGYWNLINQYKKFVMEYTTENGKAPEDFVVNKFLHISPERLDQIKKDLYNYNLLSLNNIIRKDGSGEDSKEIIEYIVDTDANAIEEGLEKEMLEKDLLAIAGKILSEKELDIVLSNNESSSNEISLQELAKKYNVTRERIRQIKKRALNKLRRSEEVRKKLGDYVGIDTYDAQRVEELKNSVEDKFSTPVPDISQTYSDKIERIEELSPYQKACLYYDIKETYCFNLEQVANIFGKTSDHVHKHLLILKFPEDLKELMIKDEINVTSGLLLYRIRDNEKLYKKFLNQVTQNEINAKELSRELKTILSSEKEEKNDNIFQRIRKFI